MGLGIALGITLAGMSLILAAWFVEVGSRRIPRLALVLDASDKALARAQQHTAQVRSLLPHVRLAWYEGLRRSARLLRKLLREFERLLDRKLRELAPAPSRQPYGGRLAQRLSRSTSPSSDTSTQQREPQQQK